MAHCRFCHKRLTKDAAQIHDKVWEGLPGQPVYACTEHFNLWASSNDKELFEAIKKTLLGQNKDLKGET